MQIRRTRVRICRILNSTEKELLFRVTCISFLFLGLFFSLPALYLASARFSRDDLSQAS